MVDRLTHHLQHRITVAEAVKFVLVAVGITVLLMSIAWEMRPSGPGAPPVEVLVQDGDTLWDLALAHGPAQADPRSTVVRIRQTNHIDGSLIRPGDVLLVPQS